MLDQKITFDRFVRGALFVLIIGFLLYLVDYLSNVLLPFFVAWLLAYMIYPLVSFLQYKLHLKSRVLCIFLTLVLIVSFIAGAIMLVVPSALEEYDKLKQIIAEYVVNGAQNSSIPNSVEMFLQENLNKDVIVNFLKQGSVMDAIKQGVPKLWSLIYETMNFVIGLFAFVLVLMYMFFILLDYEKISVGWVRLVPKNYRYFVYSLAQDVQNGMNSYFRGQALVALCVGILFSVGFTIIDFPMAIALGLFIGVLNLVPYMQLVGFIPTILLSLLKAGDTGENFWVVLLTAFAVFAVVQVIQDMILTPKIMGHIMGLNPAVILLSLSIWGALLGIIGLIIALPLTTLILSYYHRFILHDDKNGQEDLDSLAVGKQKEEIDEPQNNVE